MNKPITISELMTGEYANVEWLAKDLIPADGITIISGDPGNYKTWILLSLIKSVASGQKLFENFECKKQNVLLIDEENHPGILKQRFECLNTDVDANIFLLIREGFHIDNEDNLKQILRFIVENEIGLVCIDSLVRIHSKEENVANQMSALFNNFNQITKLGVTVVLTHHHRKQATNSQFDSSNLRGSSDILAAVDSHIAVKTNKELSQITLTQKKLRIAQEYPAFDIDILKPDYDHISLCFKGAAQAEINKFEQLKEEICLFLSDNLGQDRTSIEAKLNGKFGKNAIGKALDLLVKDKVLGENKKKRGKKIYYKYTSVEESTMGGADF